MGWSSRLALELWGSEVKWLVQFTQNRDNICSACLKRLLWRLTEAVGYESSLFSTKYFVKGSLLRLPAPSSRSLALAIDLPHAWAYCEDKRKGRMASVCYLVCQLSIKGLSRIFWGFPFLGTWWHTLDHVGCPQVSSCCPLSFEDWVSPASSSPESVRPVVVGPHHGDSRDAELLPPDDKLRVRSTQQGWQPASSWFPVFCVPHS